MSMESRPKPAVVGVSKKMIVVIVVMLVVILVPAVLVSMPLSKVVVTVMNMNTARYVTVYLDVGGAADGYYDLSVPPGEEREISCPVRSGTHDIYAFYWFSGEDYYHRTILESYEVSMFETEEIEIELVQS